MATSHDDNDKFFTQLKIPRLILNNQLLLRIIGRNSQCRTATEGPYSLALCFGRAKKTAADFTRCAKKT